MKTEKEIKKMLEMIRRNAMFHGATPIRVVAINCLEWVLDEKKKKKESEYEEN